MSFIRNRPSPQVRTRDPLTLLLRIAATASRDREGPRPRGPAARAVPLTPPSAPPPGRAALAGMMLASCCFLIYSAYVVPMQLSFWMRDDPCDPFPTLYSDALVDTYFLVGRARSGDACLIHPYDLQHAL